MQSFPGSLNDFVDVHGLVNLVGYALVISNEPTYRGLDNFIEDQCKGLIQMPRTHEHSQTFNFKVPSPCLQRALERLVFSINSECSVPPDTDTVHSRPAVNTTTATTLEAQLMYAFLYYTDSRKIFVTHIS